MSIILFLQSSVTIEVDTLQCYEILYFSRTEFVITGSVDGHVKFWKKMEESIEFVKHFRSHLGPIMDMTVNYNGSLLCTVSTDKSLKVFDVINFGEY